MADTKISALTAASVAADANEIPINEAGTTKKLTVAQLKAVMGGSGMNNLAKNGNFINNSTNGYGATPDDWVSSNANPVQGGFPSMTKQQLIDLLGISDGDIEGLWNLNEASGNATDLSSNGYNLTDTNTVLSSDDGLMGKVRDFEKDNSEYLTIANASCPNLEIPGNKTFFAFIKPETLTANSAIMIKSNSATSAAFGLQVTTGNKLRFNSQGCTPGNLDSDIVLEVGKWYLVIGVQNTSEFRVWINGVKKILAKTGSSPDTDGSFAIGKFGDWTDPSNYFDGLIQNAGVLSVALTDSQVKKLFAATLYRGQKIRRATTDAILSQALPEDLVERLRGKDVSIVARAYQTVASTMQVSIDDGTETASATNTTINAWQNIGISKTISATATAITLKLKHSTSDGNTWFKEVAFYEGSTLVYVWYSSYDDIQRFSKALRMEFADKNLGYRIEGNMAFFAGALTTTELTKDGDVGYDTTNNRLYVREQGVVKYVAMT
jgi:hypothetical protein